MEKVLDAMDDVLSMFCDPDRYRARISYIARHLDALRPIGPQPRPTYPEADLGVLQKLARDAAVPPGCERAQDVLMCAMNCYREAWQAIRRAELDLLPRDFKAADDRLRDGQALLLLAMTLADAA